MRLFFATLSIIFFGYTVQAQEALEGEDDWQQAIYVELLGNSVGASINYDLRTSGKRRDGHGVRFGIGGYPVDGLDAQGNKIEGGILTLPLAYNYLIGKRRSAFEMGAGITPMFGRVEFAEIGGNKLKDNDFTAAGFLNAGYRFRPLNKGVIFRFTWTPSVTSEGVFPLWFGISLGYGYI